MPIFRSRHQADLLTQLLIHPEQEFTLTELSRELRVPLTTVQREVQRLTETRLIRQRRQGRNRLVSADPDNPATEPLTRLVMLSFGPTEVIKAEFGGLDGVEQVVIFGSWAARSAGQPGPPPHDIDVLVIGTGKSGNLALFAAANRAQQHLGIEVNPVGCTANEWENPGDWTLLIDIKNKPHTVACRKENQDK
jgi:predicted nucleotidyltransferase